MNETVYDNLQSNQRDTGTRTHHHMATAERGRDWEFVEGSNDILWVFCSSHVRPGRFARFRRSTQLLGSKLFFQDRDNDFFNTWFDQIISITADTIERIRPRRVIFWGQSVGAYAAQVCALGINVESLTVAISPHLRLNRPRTRANEMVRIPDENWVDLRHKLESFNRGQIIMMFPCYSVRDWPHIIDAMALAAPNLTILPVRSDHGIEEFLISRSEFDPLLAAAQNGDPLRLHERIVADQQDLDLIKIGWEMFEALETGTPVQAEWPPDNTSRNNWWFDVKSRYLRKQGKLEQSLIALNRAITLNPDVGSHYESLGHFYLERGATHLAALTYALAQAKGAKGAWPRNKLKRIDSVISDEAFVNLASNLAEHSLLQP